MEIEARQMKNFSIIQEEAEEQLDRDYDDVDRALERTNIVQDIRGGEIFSDDLKGPGKKVN